MVLVSAATLLRHGVDALLDQIEFGLAGDQRHHDFRRDRLAGFAADFGRGLEDGARLHLGDFRIGDGEPAAAKAEHRIELVQFAGAVGELLRIGAHGLRHLGDFLLGVRQKFVQRRIEQPDRHRQAAHDLEQLDEIGALHRQKLGERGAARRLVVGQNHLAHGADAILVEEHMLGAAQPDAFGAEFDRGARVGRRVGIGAHFQFAHAVGPFHQRGEFAGERRLEHRHLAGQHLAGRAVDGEHVALFQRRAAGRHGLRAVIDAQRAGAGDAGLAHAARDHGRMRGHAAARGQDAFGGVHAVNVLRRGFDPHQDDLAALALERLGLFGGEHDFAAGGARAMPAGRWR